MERMQLEHRKNVLFADDLRAFRAARGKFFEEALELYGTGDEAAAIRLIKDMCIDAESFLTEWKLDRWLPAAEKGELISACAAQLEKWEASEALHEVSVQVKSIKNCRMALLSRSTLQGKLNVYWGHDKCDEIDYSLRRGASFTTSNPGKIYSFMQDNPEQWAAMLSEVMVAPGLSSEAVLQRMTMKIVAMMARHTRPIFEATGGQYGFSSIQVSPHNWDNSAAMSEEIRFWYEGMKKELDCETPNVTFKVPATPAAVETARTICGEYANIRLCATSNFSFRQNTEFYDALKNRNPAGLLVLVDVHLRTFSRPEFEAMGVENPDKYCEMLVSMVYRRCYRELRDRGLNIQLNGAGIRDTQGVRNNLTDDMALPVTLTIMPEVVRDFDENPCELIDAMNDTISEADMKILEGSKIFRQAYYAEEFPWDDVRSFPPYALMMDKFAEGYDGCTKAIEREIRR